MSMPATTVTTQEIWPTCSLSASKIVTKKQCLQFGESVQRNKYHENGCAATKCACPWRQCPACIVQNHWSNNRFVTGDARRLCAFHSAHGEKATRASIKQAVTSGASIGTTAKEAPPSPPQAAARSQHINVSAGAQKKAAPTISREQAVTAELVAKSDRSTPPTARVSYTVPSVSKSAPRQPVERPIDVVKGDFTHPAILRPQDELGNPKESELIDGVRIAGQVLEIPRHLIRPMPNQPRENFDPQELRDLAESIKARGQLRPGIVRPIPRDAEGRIYELIDGQRRWHSGDLAGLTTYCAIVKQSRAYRDQYMDSVIANFNHSEHDDYEKIKMVRRMIEEMQFSMDEVRIAVGRSIGWVKQRLALAHELDESVLALMASSRPEKERLGLTYALKVAKLPKEKQYDIATKMIEETWDISKTSIHINFLLRDGAQPSSTRKRKPSDDLFMVEFALWSLNKKIDLLLSAPDNMFTDMFTTRTATKRLQLAEQIRQLKSKLSTLEGKLRERA